MPHGRGRAAVTQMSQTVDVERSVVPVIDLDCDEQRHEFGVAPDWLEENSLGEPVSVRLPRGGRDAT